VLRQHLTLLTLYTSLIKQNEDTLLNKLLESPELSEYESITMDELKLIISAVQFTINRHGSLDSMKLLNIKNKLTGFLPC